MDRPGSGEQADSFTQVEEGLTEERLETDLSDLPLERLKSAQVQDMVVQSAISIVINRQKSAFSAQAPDLEEGSAEAGPPESEGCDLSSIPEERQETEQSTILLEERQLTEEQETNEEEAFQSAWKVQHSPPDQAKEEARGQGNGRRLKDHYSAWGGEGLDALLSKAKRGGPMYDIYVNQLKKREQKRIAKDQTGACQSSPSKAAEISEPARKRPKIEEANWGSSGLDQLGVVMKKSRLEREQEAAKKALESIN